VIAADVVITDVEPDGFGLLCALAAARQRRPRRVVSVLHHAGTVLNVVCSRDGVLDAHRETFADAPQRAATLLTETGADRVVLYDRALLHHLANRLARIPATTLPQQRVFWDNADAFWSSPAITTAPAPPVNAWRRAPEILQRAEGGWALLALYEGDRCASTLLAAVGGGLVTTITSLDAIPEATRPPRAGATQLVDAVERHLGPVRLGLICDVADLAAALEGDDVPAAVVALAEHAIWSRGLEGLP
jgi:hypothetical protein